MLTPKDLKELVEQDLITGQQAHDITRYYEIKKSSQPNRLSLILGVLGAVFIGLAVILVLAHNWDQFSNNIRVFIAFIPLVLAQIFTGYLLMNDTDQRNLKEVAGIILFFSLAATVFITSQIYHVSDPEGNFYVLWMALSVPIVYILNASVLSMLCIFCITSYLLAFGFNADRMMPLLYFYSIIAALLPYYVKVMRRSDTNNTAYWLHWLLAVAIILSLLPLGNNAGVVLLFTYAALFTLFYHIGHLPVFDNIPKQANAYLQTGRAGITIILFIAGFSGFWDEVQEAWANAEILYSRAFIASIVLGVAAIVLYVRRKQWKWFHLADMDLVLIPLFILLLTANSLTFILSNLLTLAVGLVIMTRGIRSNRLLTINFGLLIIAVLILSRFFETNLSFLIRGLVFAMIGLAFFITNYYLTKKSKRYEK